MDFQSIKTLWSWTKYTVQSTTNVTYIYVNNDPVVRLKGMSDILYIGETIQSIQKRYKQETDTSNTSGNTQGTNIRLTHILGQIGLSNVSCYFTNQATIQIPSSDPFLKKLQVWDKRNYLKTTKMSPMSVSLEKYLLVEYATAHLELPPLNNRV